MKQIGSNLFSYFLMMTNENFLIFQLLLSFLNPTTFRKGMTIN